MAVTSSKPKKQQRSSWRDEFYLRAYELASAGESDAAIARALGIEAKTLVKYITTKPALADALKKARTALTGPEGLAFNGVGERWMDFCYKRLPEDLQALWKGIEMLTGSPDDPDKPEQPDCWRRIDAMFSRPGMVRARQRLYLHALVASNFNANEACRKLCVTYNQVREWATKEPKFKELFDTIPQLMANFAEAKLFHNINSGVSGDIQFALRGLMPGRYNPKVVHKHEGKLEHEHQHAHVDLTPIIKSLPLAAKKQALAALRAAGLATELQDSEIIDVEAINGQAE